MNLSRADLFTQPHLLRLISQEDQINLGLIKPPTLPQTPPLTSSTGKEKKPHSKPELQTHAEYLHWIKKYNRSLPPDQPLLVIHADPTHKSGITSGWPDFTLFWNAESKPLFIEFKRPRFGKLSFDQQLIHRYLHSLGHTVLVAFYSNVAIEVTKNHFNLP